MQSSSLSLAPSEKQAIFSIASIYALRMLGLFMLVPILSLYLLNMHGATPLLMGLAVGGYGLTQALLQIPFGSLSDQFGRKPIIALGLVVFAIGSVIAASSHSIWGIIIGRCLQGAGAVGSASSALLADLTRDEQRTKAMAVVGITIGMAFSLAMIIGPLLNSRFTVSAIFWFTFAFALLALLILYSWVPTPIRPGKEIEQAVSAKFTTLLLDKKLLRLNLGIFFLHLILTANFVVLPLIMQKIAGLSSQEQWRLYVPTLFLALITVFPILRLTENKKSIRPLFLGSIGILGLAELGLGLFHASAIQIGISLWIFFTSFTLLEAIIPSAVSKLVAVHSRGMALGINSCYQFLGIFAGGCLGGWIYGQLSMYSVLIAGFLVASTWLLVDSLTLGE